MKLSFHINTIKDNICEGQNIPLYVPERTVRKSKTTEVTETEESQEKPRNRHEIHLEFKKIPSFLYSKIDRFAFVIDISKPLIIQVSLNTF